MNAPNTSAPSGEALGNVLSVLAVLLHLGALWLVAVSGLLAPLWAILALGAVWLGACLPLVRGLRERARWAPLVPLAVVAIWALAMTAGDVLLGWTA